MLSSDESDTDDVYALMSSDQSDTDDDYALMSSDESIGFSRDFEDLEALEEDLERGESEKEAQTLISKEPIEQDPSLPELSSDETSRMWCENKVESMMLYSFRRSSRHVCG